MSAIGRRATPGADYLAEAASILKAYGAKAPVHLVWTREDDMAGGYYRPSVLHKIRAGLDAKGAVTGWQHVMVGSRTYDLFVAGRGDARAVRGRRSGDRAGIGPSGIGSGEAAMPIKIFIDSAAGSATRPRLASSSRINWVLRAMRRVNVGPDVRFDAGSAAS